MTDLHNPLFEDEKEFLEQKKLEYERALLGDVEHIKEKTTQVGKYALAGAGVAGGVWLISKLVRGKKKRPRRFENDAAPGGDSPKSRKDKKAAKKDPNAPKSAAASAAVFQEVLGFDEAAPAGAPTAPGVVTHVAAKVPLTGPASFQGQSLDTRKAQPSAEPDPFEPQAHPEATAAPTTKPAAQKKPSFSEKWPAISASATSTLGTLAKAAWQSEAARSLLSQAVAAGIAALAGHSAAKSAVAEAQEPKNPDLAASSGATAAGAGGAQPFSSAQPAFSDATRQHPA